VQLSSRQANLRQRVGVWSIYRNGDPGGDFTRFLRRTLGTASHELCHVLTLRHCTAFRCLMNGSNHQQERDARLLHPCPVCLRKLCWNLRVEPAPYLTKLNAFCQKNGLGPESAWYERAVAALATSCAPTWAIRNWKPSRSAAHWEGEVDSWRSLSEAVRKDGREAVFGEVLDDGPSGARLLEQGEQQADDLLHLLVRVEDQPAGRVEDQASGRAHAQFALFGAGQFAAEEAITQFALRPVPTLRRSQPCGAGRSERRRVAIPSVLVNAHLFVGAASDTLTTYRVQG
jgi:hypothetical protein